MFKQLSARDGAALMKELGKLKNSIRATLSNPQ
jgi:hypothetical protein